MAHLKILLILLLAVSSLQAQTVVSRRGGATGIAYVFGDTLTGMSNEQSSPVSVPITTVGGTNTYSIFVARVNLTFGAGNTWIDSVTVDSAAGGGAVKLDSLAGTGWQTNGGGLWMFGTKNVKAGERTYKIYAGALFTGSFSAVEFSGVDQTTPVVAQAQVYKGQVSGDQYLVVSNTAGQMMVDGLGGNLSIPHTAKNGQTIKIIEARDVAGGQEYYHSVGISTTAKDSTGWNTGGLDYTRICAVVLKPQ